MAKQKLSEKEIKDIKTLQQNSENLQKELGQITLMKYQLEEREEKAKDFRNKLVTEEKELSEKLQRLYGDGSIDLENGYFVSSDDQNAEEVNDSAPNKEPSK